MLDDNSSLEALVKVFCEKYPISNPEQIATDIAKFLQKWISSLVRKE
ncbi:PqqD family protein [Sulfobacillus thermosulfidooxidans]